MSVSDLTIDNLENGKSKLTYPNNGNSNGNGELADLFQKNKESGRIIKVLDNNNIDCDKYNYYHEEYVSKFGQPYYVIKIVSVFGCKRAVESTGGIVYRVERKNRPAGEKFKSGVTSFFSKPAATTDGETIPPAPSNSGGRRSRTQRRNQRKSHKSKNQRKSRRSRR